MTKRIYTPDSGWTVVEDPAPKAPTPMAVPASILVDDEPEQVPIDKLKHPFGRMLNGHIIVRIDRYRRPSSSRIHLPQKAQGQATKGDCIAVASDITDIKVGDKVLYSQFAGYLLAFEGMPLMRCIGYSEVLGILKEDAPQLVSESV